MLNDFGAPMARIVWFVLCSYVVVVTSLWHSHTFVFPSQVRNFSVAEAEYLHKYFSLTGDEFRNFVLTGRWVGNRMSSYSYSHRVKPQSKFVNTTSAPDARNRHAKSIDPAPTLKVDSSRFRVGTTSQEHILLPFALAVLAERNIQPPEGLCTRDQNASLSTGLRVCYEGADRPTTNSTGAFIFYGFGWDMAIDAFKVYYMFHGLDTVPQPLREKVGLNVRKDCHMRFFAATVKLKSL